MTKKVTFISPEAEADVVLLRSDRVGRLKFGALMILLTVSAVVLFYMVDAVQHIRW